MHQAKLTTITMVNRIVVSLLGGYVFTWGFTAFGMAGLVALGVNFHEAETTMMLLAILLYLPLFLWAFASPHLSRVWIIIVGGAALMLALAWAIQQMIL